MKSAQLDASESNFSQITKNTFKFIVLNVYMKRLPVLIAMMSAAFVGNAFAVSGSINFTGVVSASVCTINDVAGSGSDVGSIDFGTIHSDELLTVNARATPEPFSITFSNCPSSEAPKITFSGDPVDITGMTLASGIENVGILNRGLIRMPFHA